MQQKAPAFSRSRWWGALLALGIALGCMPPAPPPAPPPAIASRYPELPGAYFGVKITDPDGRSRFLQTDVVPNLESQRYGWFIWVGETQTPIRWTETLELPGPATWPDVAAATGIAVSPDRRAATIEAEALPTRGFVSHFWEVVPGDPSGPHQIVVRFADGREERFGFALAVPGIAVEPTSTR